jgi:hypothetical protein
VSHQDAVSKRGSLNVTPIQIDRPIAPTPSHRPAAGSGLAPYRLTVGQFVKMIDAGVFHNDDRVELLGGILVDKMVKNDPHEFAIDM